MFIGQFAPPVHGVSVMNDYVISSKLLNEEYDFVTINLTTAKTIDNIGKISLGKYVRFIGIVAKTLGFLIKGKYCCTYVTLSPVGFAFVKDRFIVSIIRLFKVPIVLHLHGKGINKAISNGGLKIRRRYNQAFKNTHVICLSENLREDIKQINSYTKVHTVNNGIAARDIYATKEVRSSKISILMLSNLIKSKGALDLLVAIKIMVDENITNFEAVFAGAWGEDNFEEEFNHYVTENTLDKYIILPGPVFGRDKAELLAQADIFTLPTYYPNECFPLVILEAMSHHLVVIASKEGAIPEIIDHGENGYLVDARSPEMIAKALESLINNPELMMTIGTNAADKFNRHYRLDIFEKNLLTVFNEISN